MRALSIGIASLGLLLLASCGSVQPVQSQVLLNHQTCSNVRAGVSEVQLAELTGIRGSRLISLNDRADDQAELPELSAATRLFAVSRGQMPTAGYRIELQQVSLDAQTLIIDLDWRAPDPATVQAQMLTHPCLVVAVPIAGAETVLARSGEEELGRLALAPR
jgi:hypothetical protein